MRFVVAFTGASGAAVGLALVEELRRGSQHEVRTVVSEAGRRVMQLETGGEIAPDHQVSDIAADIASGSSPVDAMVICPCSMKTLAAVAHGYADSLITRTADNCLRMRRTLILCVRETPLSLIHIDNMRRVTEAGGIVMPLCAGYYFQPRSMADLNRYFVGRILELCGLDHDLYPRWRG
jgi:flavin prenyltransferase